jgi:glycosyltransferase involved in cell wall biosynthesis
MKKLYIITTKFPFGIGESFLETEIKYLSNHFQNIVILPTHLDNKNKRKVPNNVTVDTSLANFNSEFSFSKFEFFTSKYFFHSFSINIFNYNYLKILYSYVKTIYLFNEFFNKNFKPHELKNNLFYTYWFSSETVGLTFLKKYNFNLITRAHRFDLYENVNNISKFPFRQYVLNNIDQVHLISKHGITHLKQNYKPKKNTLFYSPLGTENFNSFNKITSKTKSINIVSCSFFKKVKRIDLIVKALSYINDLQINWYHIGGGELENYILQLAKEKIKSNNITVHFLGNMKNSEVYNFYKNNQIDAFINVSSSEGVPVSIMEAQSFGIPVIATKVGGVSEIVNNENGFLLPENPRIDEIVGAIKKVFSDEWYEKRNKAYQFWLDNYNAETNYNKFSKIIMKIK